MNYKIKVGSEAESKEAQGLFYGVGFRGGKHKGYDGNNQKNEYRLWMNVLKRCYSKWFSENRPSYNGCFMSDNFKSYDYFYEWCNNQIGFIGDNFALDKDLLIKGNRVYSENTCVFLPRDINNALILRKSKRGRFPIGVSFSDRDNRFRAVLTMFGENVCVGYFKDVESAFNKYKEVKELYLKSLAEMYKGNIDNRAYDALVNYEVSIND